MQCIIFIIRIFKLNIKYPYPIEAKRSSFTIDFWLPLRYIYSVGNEEILG